MYSAKSVVFDKALKIIKVIKNKQYDIMNIQVQAQVILNQHRVNSQAGGMAVARPYGLKSIL